MRSLAVLFSLLVFSLPSAASHRHKHPRAEGSAGQFDYYLFVLSWSPEFCQSKPNSSRCAEHRGFIVHGLWPQNKDGSYPQHCATSQPGPTNPSTMADIMPKEIILHEWQTHGTCSGLSGDNYFALIRKVHDALQIPANFQAPSAPFVTKGTETKSEFEQANPGLNDAEVRIQLRQGYLDALKFCVSRGTTPVPVACSGQPDGNGGTFRVPVARRNQ